MNEALTINNALERLTEQTGITGRWLPADTDIDGELDLLLNNGEEHIYVEVKKELRNFHLPKIFEAADKYQPFMVVADRIFPTLKAILRERNIAYLDGAGNIYVKTPNQFVWLDGNKTLEPERPVTNRAFTKTGLRLVFYLLLHPDRINLPYRHFHMATHIALGNIKNIMTGLKDAGFLLQINEREIRLQNKKALLNRWIAGYQEALKPALHIGNYRFVNAADIKNWQTLQITPNNTNWGGEAAAELLTNYLTPETLTLYTGEKKPAFIPKWKLIPDPNGYLRVYEKFWYNEDTYQFIYAPPLLVYADLIITGDPRCIETAEVIYKQYLQNEFE